MEPLSGNPRGPWNPDRQWADPLLTLLALLAVFLGMVHLHSRSTAQERPPEQAGLVGRIAEVEALGAKLGGGASPLRGALLRLRDQAKDPWDRALLSVLLAENGEAAAARRLALEGPLPAGPGPAFRRGWSFAYQDGLPPTAAERQDVLHALGGGYGARLLEARWAEKEGRDAGGLRREAEAIAMGRLALFGGLGFAVLLLGLGGAVFAVMLIVTRKVPRRFAPAVYAMSTRAALLVFFGWLDVMLLSGFLVALLVAALPLFKPLALPFGYLFHASAGVFFLCSAEDISFPQLVRRIAPGAHGRSLAWGIGFLALAVAAVVAVALLLGPFLKTSQPPQRELMDVVANTHGTLTVALLFLTVSVLAPCFEELMFRGFLLPVLNHRWRNLRNGTLLALVATGLLFGFIHLQPVALPTLATLGLVLGLAFLRTGNLLTSILVHGLWNGGVFLVMRFFLA